MTYNTINDARTIAGNAEGTLLANRYRVVKQLGQGGMGAVWLAEDTQLDNKLFAIKMLPSILVSNKRAYRQLKDEALVAMRLVHPNIVQIRAFEENDGNPFLVMDYVDGQTLDDYLAEHTGTTGVPPVAHGSPGTTGILPVAHGIPEADVLRILRPIAAALDYAHAKGVVHRDVKPGNVMIAKDGTPYILDFGIAREIQETLTRVTGKLSSGTLLYMSPEQLNGAQPKPAQDVYSFAAMIYECLKGEPPFARGQIEYQILNNPPDPLPGGPRSCAAAIMAGLAKKPEDRPASCTAVLEGHIPDAPPPGRARSPSAPHGGVWKVLLVVTVLALVIGGGWWLSSRVTKRTRATRGTHTTESIGTAKITDTSEITKPAKKPTTKGKVAVQDPMTNLSAEPIRNPMADNPSGKLFSGMTATISMNTTNAVAEPSTFTNAVSVAAATNVVPVFSVQAALSNETAAALAAARAAATPQDARETLSYAAETLGSAEALYELARVDDFLGWGAFVRTRDEKERRPPWTKWLRRIDLLGEKRAVVMQQPATNDLVHRKRALDGYRAAAALGVPEAVDALARHASHENEKDRRRSCKQVATHHKKVQLWEGGPYWAETNIGAENPWNSGYYFWWGDTVGYKREGDAWVASDGSSSEFSFSEGNTPTNGKNPAALQSAGWITADGVLSPEHDAAQVQWGGEWRMPTNQEMDDLKRKCDWTWTEINGECGYAVRGRGSYASAGIYLPAAGYGNDVALNDVGSYGGYWSSAPYSYSNNIRLSWYIFFFNSDYFRLSFGRRDLGQSIRPVQGFTK